VNAGTHEAVHHSDTCISYGQRQLTESGRDVSDGMQQLAEIASALCCAEFV
jgi:hypothetical protein